MKSFIKRLLAAPLCFVTGALGDVDEEELARAVEKRRARAERAVLRDYLLQHGVEGDEAEDAMESLSARLRERLPSREKLDALARRAQQAESELKRTRFDSSLRLRLARLGVPEKYANDVLLLASKELEQSGEEQDGESAGAAIDAVLARLPALAPEQNAQGTGTRGNYPRQDDAHALYQHRLESARASADNAAAVRIIAEAAEKGITLR